jgi:hypothetical protein
VNALLVDQYGAALPASDAPAVIHPAWEKGYASGAACAPNDDLLTNMVGVSLDCMLDETQPDHDRERSYENMTGFVAGYHDMMAVKPLLFLTRQQTAHVNRLPRRIRRAWLSEYERGCRQWQRRGGAMIGGNRPVLPEIPG